MAREFSGWFNNHRVAISSEHVVDRYLESLRPLGISAPDRADSMCRGKPETSSRSIGCSSASVGTVPFALLNPGAGGRRNAGRPSDLPRSRGILASGIGCHPWSCGPARRNGRQPTKSSKTRAVTRPWPRIRRSRNWPNWPAEPRFSSAPIPGLCTWRRRSARRALGCSAPCPPSETAPTAPSTSPCKKHDWKAPAASAARQTMPRCWRSRPRT